MPHKWSKDTRFERVPVKALERRCPVCRGPAHVHDSKTRYVFSLEGPKEIATQMTRCCNKDCPGFRMLVSSELEMLLAPPKWAIAWDVFLWIGHRRLSRHWSVPQIDLELRDSYEIGLSEDAIENYIRRYQRMLAARHQAPEMLAEAYSDIDDLLLSIDGLQPEKGHETLYVVRELRAKRVWFAVPLLSSSAEEIRALFEQAKEWAKRLGKPVSGWMSDKQDAFVKGVKKVFPGIPHRYCKNHFLRDVAAPVLAADSKTKVKMRKKVRGLRGIERSVLDRAREEGGEKSTGDEIVLDFCAATRGILNSSQGGHLEPPGLRMAEGLKEVRASVQRLVDLQVGGDAQDNLQSLGECIDRGLAEVREEQEEIAVQVEEVRAVDASLDPKTGKTEDRQAAFQGLVVDFRAKDDPVHQQMAGVMESFEPGLFGGEDAFGDIQDNLDLERWFKLPKKHKRKIHGRQHAGVGIVQEGPTLLPALDAHDSHPCLFQRKDLQPYLDAAPPDCETEAIGRRKVMKKARSKKKRRILLAELERRYRCWVEAQIAKSSIDPGLLSTLVAYEQACLVKGNSELRA